MPTSNSKGEEEQQYLDELTTLQVKNLCFVNKHEEMGVVRSQTVSVTCPKKLRGFC